ncbi:MAG: CBS domain-containing protein [Myxococcaceae bacterium]
MATNDPKSRLTEGNLNTPYNSPNGVNEQQEGTGRTGVPVSTPGGIGASASAASEAPRDESAGEKIGRFFRKAMDRIAGHDDEEWRRRNEERSRAGLSAWQSGRSGVRDRSENEWKDLGRSRDDRNQNYRAGPPGDTAGSYERLQGGQQGTSGRLYGQPSFAGGEQERSSFEPAQRSGEQARPGQGQGYGQSAYGQGQSGVENRDRQTPGQRALGRSPGEGGGLPETSDREIGTDRGFEGGYGRDDQSRSGARSTQSGPAGMSPAYAGSGASFGYGREDERAGDWSETSRDRDQGQGRRFWQREPLSARDVMTRKPKTVTRQTSIREAALVMRDENCGVVPVVDGAGRLEGILTDRDIVVRGLIDEGTLRRIEDVMTDDVSAVTEDEPLTSVLDLMGRKQIRRVPVVDRDDRLLGIISMADIANRADYDEDLQDAFERISSRRSFWSLFS